MSRKTEPRIEMASVAYINPTTPPSSNQQSTDRQSTYSNFLPEEPLVTEQEIETKPWKYIGYKGYSSFIASDNDFYIVRRFAALNTRIALALQDEVTVLEEELSELDARYSRRDAEDLHNGSFRDDREDRTALVEKIGEKLLKYSTTHSLSRKAKHISDHLLDAFMLQQSSLQKAPPTCPQDIKNLRNWHYNHSELAISAAETAYLNHDLDLYSVVPKEKTPLRRLLDRSRKFRIHSLWKSAKAPKLPVYDQDVITYTDDKRVDRFVTIVIVGVGTVMLLMPMWILQALHSNNLKLVVITIFVVVFLGLVGYATVAKPFETLAATAA